MLIHAANTAMYPLAASVDDDYAGCNPMSYGGFWSPWENVKDGEIGPIIYGDEGHQGDKEEMRRSASLNMVIDNADIDVQDLDQANIEGVIEGVHIEGVIE